ncbi:hypothetical protein GQ43DRAFT_469074 [Delitschia confertaspora ATCC 74209]|uniref:Uncharacterized protein n=1 Tax=Delitschia confertaspora ATCC 74209 TaxID=1513339 RepID=A0A9P4JXN5_9PLEO|nr:hypothetical protein GQ43DRAFT_469074 [Delitschia confertaspora ATCC 74209]
MSSSLGISTQPEVHYGFWVNWSRGQVLGSTLTLTQRNGAVLITFVALFITFVGSRFWRILCFWIHHAYTKPGPQDCLHHQRQAVLKNSDNATAGLINWYQLLKAWHRSGRRPYRRILPIALFTATVLILFTAASLLSSRISSATGNEVLIDGKNCGVNILGHYIAGQDKNPEVETSPEFFTILLPFLAQRLVSFSNYALSCYSDNNKNAPDCNTFVKARLHSTSNYTAGCPFRDDICRLTQRNLLIDTGYLNSDLDLGMNAQPKDRFFYRRKTHCAPLTTEGYKSSVNFTHSEALVLYTQYHFGSRNGTGNITYKYPDRPLDEYIFGKKEVATAYSDYILGQSYYNVINGSISQNRAFIPIDALHRDDADVNLIFLSSNQVVSPIPINDPWYSSHRTIPGFRLNYTGWRNLTLGGYFADETASVLGCASQYQICYPDSHGKPSRCSRLGGKQELYWLLTSLNQTDKQLSRTRWSIMSAMTGNEIGAFVQTLGAASLSSRYSLVAGMQGPLPDNQWQKDVEHWHASSLAAIQSSAIDAATGPSDPDMRPFWPRPENKIEKEVCGNQKVLSNAHSNFSVFGLAFTLGLGGIITILSFTLEPLFSWISKRSHKRRLYSQLEWCLNGTFQLQRLAHEEAGYGTWEKCMEEVPVCLKDEVLAGICGDIKGHPTLYQKQVANNEVEEVLVGLREKRVDSHAIEEIREAGEEGKYE